MENIELISVIMSLYNESETYLRKSIESILKQTMENFEFIIILDNPDNLNAKKILLDYKKNNPRIVLHFNEKNIGLTRSLNFGLELAKGDYIARMDADDISEINRLEYQYNYLCKNHLDLVGSSISRISENDEIVYKFTNPSYPFECISKLLRYDDCVPHPTWFVKKEVYKDLYNYRNIVSCEDYDFLLRAKKRGYKIGICDAVLLKYRINTKGISRTNGLKQMLSAKYLRDNYSRIEEVNQKEVDLYLEKRSIKEKDEVSYEKSLNLLNDIIEEIKKKKIWKIVFLPLIVIQSRYIVYNLKNILIMQQIKRKYN